MSSKMNNLISYTDFTSSWKVEKAKKTARTETGLDILDQKGKGVDVEKKHVTDSTKTISNGLSKEVVK